MYTLREADIKQMNALTLAYMGDAVYEQAVREHLIRSGRVKPQVLHKEALRYVSAKSQASIVKMLQETGILTEEESAVLRRGRNAKAGSVPKNTDVITYNYSSAFEAIIGYLYLLGCTKRLTEIIATSIRYIEQPKEEWK